MREVKHYVCETCGTEYNDKLKAEKCEKSHVKPVKITDSRYVSLNNNGTGYPISITVKMADGHTIIYKR